MARPKDEPTLVIAKPGVVRRGRDYEMLARFKTRGLWIIASRIFVFDEPLVERFYSEHVDTDFYNELKETMMGGPSHAAVVYGPNAVHLVTEMVGHTDPLSAHPGTQRGDFGLWIGDNAAHRSRTIVEARREIDILFPDQQDFKAVIRSLQGKPPRKPHK